jgi:hypothetical protein
MFKRDDKKANTYTKSWPQRELPLAWQNNAHDLQMGVLCACTAKLEHVCVKRGLPLHGLSARSQPIGSPLQLVP